MPLRVRRLALRFFPAVFLLAFAHPGSAQDTAAPEQQLRQRAEEVYRLVVAGEWRKVEQYVTEDTRDLWYSQPKSPIESFEIGEIKIDPDGLRADVTVRATFQVARVPVPVTMPLKGEWVSSDGVWYLKVKKPPTLLEMYQATGAVNSPFAARSPLVFDQDPIRIPKSDPGSDIVVRVPFRNPTADTVTFRDLGANCSCLTVETDKTLVRPKGSGTLTLTYHSAIPLPSEIAPAVQAVLTPSMHILNLPVVIEPRAGE
jgi:hypothetical protein